MRLVYCELLFGQDPAGGIIDVEFQFDWILLQLRPPESKFAILTFRIKMSDSHSLENDHILVL